MNERASTGSAPTLEDAPSASSALAHLVYTILQADNDVQLISLSSHAATMQFGKKATVVLLAWDSTRAEEISHTIKELAKQPAKGTLVICLVGGTHHVREVLKGAIPWLTHSKVAPMHVDDSGATWNRDAPPVVLQALSTLGQTPPPSKQIWSRLLEQNAASLAENTQMADELKRFSATIESRRPVVTMTLAGVMVGVFGLEYLFGGTQSVPVLMRMGGLSPEHVFAGEVWRLFSCTFLHSGPSHVFFNTYVLLVLGSFLERVLGVWRFLLLYGLACLGGSLVSLAFLDGFSVGASGGLWGLLAAQAVLAWRHTELLPRSIVPSARRAAAINFVINLLNSFRPHVNMWAHFGGGAVGAVLLLSGAFIRSVPHLGECEGRAAASDAEITIPASTRLKVAAGGLAAALVCGLGLGLAMGKPWSLKRPLGFLRAPLPDLGISLELPVGLLRRSNAQEEPATVTVGDLISDPGAVIVTAYAADLHDEAELAKEHAALVATLQKAPQGARRKAGPDDVMIAGARGVTVIYRYENGVEEEFAFVFLADTLVKVDALRWPSFDKVVPQGYATRVLESVQLLSSP